MIHTRAMTSADIALGMRLKFQAGWNQTEADWRRMLALEPAGCFVAEMDGMPVGTVATCVLRRVGWIAMMLVDERYRRRGVGRALMGRAIEFLERQGVRTIRLDATPLGMPLYKKLGFAEQFRLTRYGGSAIGQEPVAADVQLFPVDAEHHSRAITLDEEVTRTSRTRFLARLFAEQPQSTRVAITGSKLEGYMTSRPGSTAAFLGPAVASNDLAGVALVGDALHRHQGQQVLIDIPQSNAAAIACIESAGLQPQRELVRMCRGEPVIEQVECLWASSGPEMG